MELIFMRIEDGIKLDFCDVLLKPKRSTLSSRKDVDITRTFKFRHSSYTWTGIPIISSNMSSVTTPEVAESMVKRGMLACLPKTNTLRYEFSDNTIPSIGLDGYIGTFCPMFCLDVPNGYIEAVIDMTKKIRTEMPDII